MSDATALSFASTSVGVTVSGPLTTAASARQALSDMNAMCPGEIFTLSTSDGDAYVVTWVPGWIVGNYLGQAVASAAQGGELAWPPIIP
jgi:hypothetical protein